MAVGFPDLENVAKLQGRQKAAVLLVALGSEAASSILRHLSEDEVEHLSLEMAKIGYVPAAATHAVFDEVAQTARALGYTAEGGVAYAQEVLERALGAERASEVMGRLSAVIDMRPFEFLRRTPPEQIHAFLRNESPETQALVIANLHVALAAQVLALLDPDDQATVALRIARMSDTSPDVIREVEAVVKQKLSNVISQEYAAAGGVKSLADILNHADRGVERHVLDRVAEEEPKLAEEVRLLLFVFEDIAKLDDRSVQLILKDVDQKDLAIALRGVSDEVTQKVLSNMSQRGAEMLREEMEFQPPQRRSVVEEAQTRIVAIVRRLEEAGAITIGRDEDDLVV